MASLPVIWWNDTVVAGPALDATTELLPPGGDRVIAFCTYVENLKPRPKAIRLFYSAASLQHVVTPCANKSSRHMVRKILSPKFPLIGEPTTAWAIHRVRSNAAGSTTVLYVDQDHHLAHLQGELQRRGIRLEGAFPLLTLVEAIPEAKQRERPVIALIHTEREASVFWITSDGDRHVEFYDGLGTGQRVTDELTTAFSAFEGKSAPVFLVVALGKSEFMVPQKPTQAFTGSTFLAHAKAMGARDVTNLFTPEGIITSDHLCYAASVALVVGLAATGLNYRSETLAARSMAERQRAQERTLTEGNARLRSNQAWITRAEAALSEFTVSPPGKLLFLETLNRTRSPSISIRKVSMTVSTWTVTGFVHEGVGQSKGPLATFLEAFSKAGPWTMSEASRSPPALRPEFTISGTFP